LRHKASIVVSQWNQWSNPTAMRLLFDTAQFFFGNTMPAEAETKAKSATIAQTFGWLEALK
jgi:hypothetical protein